MDKKQLVTQLAMMALTAVVVVTVVELGSPEPPQPIVVEVPVAVDASDRTQEPTGSTGGEAKWKPTKALVSPGGIVEGYFE